MSRIEDLEIQNAILEACAAEAAESERELREKIRQAQERFGESLHAGLRKCFDGPAAANLWRAFLARYPEIDSDA